jgi:hypothetical protein
MAPAETPPVEEKPIQYGLRTVNGELAPWRLRPRPIPVPVESPVDISTVRKCSSDVPLATWSNCIAGAEPLTLATGSSHTLELQAECHSTAFLQWTFRAADKPSRIRLKVMYSEGYEHEPRSYPFFRSKGDRLDAENGHLIGPFDEVTLDIIADQPTVYEPFWFRTFRIMRLELSVPPDQAPVEFVSFTATQTNYPLDVKASFSNPSDPDAAAIWDVSIRTIRNCAWDCYSDCRE